MSSTYERIWLNASGFATPPARLWNCAPDTPDRKLSKETNGAAAPVPADPSGPAGAACAGDQTPLPIAIPTAATSATHTRAPILDMTTPHLGTCDRNGESPRHRQIHEAGRGWTGLHTAEHPTNTPAGMAWRAGPP